MTPIRPHSNPVARGIVFQIRRSHGLGLAASLVASKLLAAAPDGVDRPLGAASGARPMPVPVVEAEEDVYRFKPADNGAGPMWCHGSTCLVRVGDNVFASGLETVPEFRPLNNCRWMLFRRDASGWAKLFADTEGRTREPCPLTAFADGRIFLSANPALPPVAESGGGPARPQIWQFTASDPNSSPTTMRPRWEDSPKFTEHSYRSFAADGTNGELILFQNIGYTHAEWAFRDRSGQWTANGQLKWPWGGEYEKPEPIRVCYPNVALVNRAVYFCGVSDIIEPNPAWRAFKKQLTGREWDYDFRRLFYTWTPDIRKEGFHEWVEISSREKTCGWITPADLWVAPDGRVNLLWTERAIDERLRKKFFPEVRQSHALNYAVVRDGNVELRRTLLLGEEGGASEVPGGARFHVTTDGRLFVVCYVSGRDPAGKAVSENRLIEVRADGLPGRRVRLPLRPPFTEFFTATPRAGCPPSDTLDLLGLSPGAGNVIRYARVRLASLPSVTVPSSRRPSVR